MQDDVARDNADRMARWTNPLQAEITRLRTELIKTKAELKITVNRYEPYPDPLTGETIYRLKKEP